MQFSREGFDVRLVKFPHELVVCSKQVNQSLERRTKFLVAIHKNS